MDWTFNPWSCCRFGNLDPSFAKGLVSSHKSATKDGVNFDICVGVLVSHVTELSLFEADTCCSAIVASLGKMISQLTSMSAVNEDMTCKYSCECPS